MLTKYIGALVGTGMALLVAVGPTAAAAEPRTLKIAGILSAGKEAPWETSFVDSMNRVVAVRVKVPCGAVRLGVLKVPCSFSLNFHTLPVLWPTPVPSSKKVNRM